MSEFEKIVELVADIFDCDPDCITEETDFAEDLCADSLDGVELAMMLEEEFELKKLTEMDFSPYRTVGDVVAFIKAKSK